MKADIANLSLFDEYRFIEKYGHELTEVEIETIEQRMTDLDRRIIGFADAAKEVLQQAIDNQEYEAGCVAAADLLELMSGTQRYLYKTREALSDLKVNLKVSR